MEARGRPQITAMQSQFVFVILIFQCTRNSTPQCVLKRCGTLLSLTIHTSRFVLKAPIYACFDLPGETFVLLERPLQKCYGPVDSSADTVEVIGNISTKDKRRIYASRTA